MNSSFSFRAKYANKIILQDISKFFPGVQALKEVSMTIKGGEVVAIVGENGAGKSTLMKVLAGIYPSNTFSGKIIINDEEVKFSSVQDAEKAGIALIPQELNIVPEMSIAENIFLNWEDFIINKQAMANKAKELLLNFDLTVDPLLPIKNLGIGQRQICLLVRALVHEARFVIFDEPTAAIGGKEVEDLFKVIRNLRDSGVGCVFVSHRIDEVLKLADRVVVMRNGEYITELPIKGSTISQIVHYMVGRNLSDMYYRNQQIIGEPVLEVKEYSVFSPILPYRNIVKDFNLTVHKGEIVSIFGLVGAGRTELVSALFGMWEGQRRGEVRILGERKKIQYPRDAINAGLVLLSEDRHRYGTFLNLNVEENINLGSLEKISRFQILDQEQSQTRAVKAIESLHIKTSGIKTNVSTLSGGNQQKVLLGRLLTMQPKVIILDEPTRGVDVGAKAEIFAILNQLTSQGLGILMVSSETIEVLGVSDRIIVLYKGMITAEFTREEATEHKLLEAATGGTFMK